MRSREMNKAAKLFGTSISKSCPDIPLVPFALKIDNDNNREFTDYTVVTLMNLASQRVQLTT